MLSKQLEEWKEDIIILNQQNNMLEKYLWKKVSLTIDRPIGSKHPNHDRTYPVNYGYLPNTVSWDWEEIDVYVLGEFEPIKEFEWKVIALIKRKNDNEEKLVVSKYKTYSEEEIRELLDFQEKFFDIEIILAPKKEIE